MNAYLFKYVPIAYMDACLSIFAKSIIEFLFFEILSQVLIFFCHRFHKERAL